MGKISVWITIFGLMMLVVSTNSIKTICAVGPNGCQCGLKFLPGQEVGIVDVSKDSDGKTTMKMIAFCNFKFYVNFSELHFNISASSELGWMIEIDPYDFKLTPSYDSQLIDVNITVPKNTSFYILDTITISGKAVINKSEITRIIEPQTATIRIKQYYGMEINKDALSKTIEKGNNKSLNFTIKNTGNARDLFEIEVKNQTALENAEITLSYPTSIEIESWEKQSVKVLINTTKESQINDYNFDLIITSNQEERNTGFSNFNKTIKFSIEIVDENKNSDSSSMIVFIRFLIVILLFGLILISIYSSKKLKKKKNKKR